MMKHPKTSVLIFTAFYLPGYKGGGPIRTIANMVNTLGNELDFSIVTLDRDLGDTAPYPSINSNCWQPTHNALIYYMSPSGSLANIWRVIRNFHGDAIHLNSFFSFRFGILPLLVSSHLKPTLPIIIGPRGEFSEGALTLKFKKKQAYIKFVKFIGLYRKVIWHASTPLEAKDIHRVMGEAITVRTAIDIATPKPELPLTARDEGSPLKVIFLSRISPKKNLLGAIEILKSIECPLNFHVYGPVEDKSYWHACREAAATLPSNISFEYKGALSPDMVSPTMAEYDVFFFPTLGENFGHVIAEALSAGLPTLISTNTPWRNLENLGLGWDVPLEHPEAFAHCIQICYTMSSKGYLLWRRKIRSWALQNIGNQESVEQTRQLFTDLKLSHEH